MYSLKLFQYSFVHYKIDCTCTYYVHVHNMYMYVIRGGSALLYRI